jgi:hypothetical protein
MSRFRAVARYLGQPQALRTVAAAVSSNWLDGSIRADDDPYWDAVERQRRAIADWRAAFPEAAAALPPGGDGEQHRAAWAEWVERFPEAASRRKQAWRPTKDFLQ